MARDRVRSEGGTRSRSIRRISKDRLVVWRRRPWSDDVWATYKVTNWSRSTDPTGIKAGGWIFAIEGEAGSRSHGEKTELVIIFRDYRDFARWEITWHTGDHGEFPDNDYARLWDRYTNGPNYAKGRPRDVVYDPITLLVGTLSELMGWKRPYRAEAGYTFVNPFN